MWMREDRACGYVSVGRRLLGNVCVNSSEAGDVHNDIVSMFVVGTCTRE